jgi:hypothetical protein
VFVFHYPARAHDSYVAKKAHHGSALDRTLPSAGQAATFRHLRESGMTYSDVYRRTTWDDAKVARGIERQRAVIDERLSRFLAARPSPSPAGPEGPPAEATRSPELADLIEDLAATTKEWDLIRRRLDRAERRAVKAERRERKTAARLERSEARSSRPIRARAATLARAVRRRGRA